MHTLCRKLLFLHMSRGIGAPPNNPSENIQQIVVSGVTQLLSDAQQKAIILENGLKLALHFTEQMFDAEINATTFEVTITLSTELDVAQSFVSDSDIRIALAEGEVAKRVLKFEKDANADVWYIDGITMTRYEYRRQGYASALLYAIPAICKHLVNSKPELYCSAQFISRFTDVSSNGATSKMATKNGYRQTSRRLKRWAKEVDLDL